ncbi:WhiB family transcriptional regulator [Streptacidiphilus sp. EB129]|uniref:WhiB family transcriptional regulator n=1 Tax=Streptacidiphilus sp. EB129 TaxID=3156262 RepID=UPI003513BF85
MRLAHTPLTSDEPAAGIRIEPSDSTAPPTPVPDARPAVPGAPATPAPAAEPVSPRARARALAARRRRQAPWTGQAACRGADPETFFPHGQGPEDVKREATAKSYCARCPVAMSCLRDALVYEENVGVWGGLNVKERRELRRVSQTLGQVNPELLVRLENGAQVRPRPVDRVSLVWALRIRGWAQPNIATALGLTISQVRHACQQAEYAALCDSADGDWTRAGDAQDQAS